MRQRLRLLHLGEPQGGVAGRSRSQNNLYWYPTLYEGRECSKNVIYTGAVPNQQQDEFVPWLIKNFGKKFYLIGSNYIYPKEENNYCTKLLEKHGGEVVEEEYVPLGHSEFSSVINKFRQQQPNVIFSTVVGDLVVALHRQYRAAGLDPAKMPMASLTTSENEIAAMGGEAAAGHFTSAPYFMVYKSPENEKFVAAYKKRWGADKVTHFVSEACYFQTYLFKQAVEKLGRQRHYAEDHPRSRQGVGDDRAAGQGAYRTREPAHLAVAEDRARPSPTDSSKSSSQSKEWLKPDALRGLSRSGLHRKGPGRKEVLISHLRVRAAGRPPGALRIAGSLLNAIRSQQSSPD